MGQVCAIMGLIAETSIHAGAGASTGVIDLPIQREAHTGWPVVFGSGVKGAMRTRAVEHSGGMESEPWIREVFGRDASDKDSADYAGALAVGDARLLLLPVRSLTSHFKWVTCPALLRRYSADRKRMGLAEISAVPQPGEHEAVVYSAATPAGPLFLEEYSFTPKPASADEKKEIKAIAQLIAHPGIEDMLSSQVVVVANNMFTHLCKHATPVTPHVKISNSSKTVEQGALWYEETLPTDTVLYSCLIANPVRRKTSDEVGNALNSAAEVLSKVRNNLFKEESNYLQLGGNETVGMGWCVVNIAIGREGN